MSWLRKLFGSEGGAKPEQNGLSADEALREAHQQKKQADEQTQELAPILNRLERDQKSNYIAEAVEETLRKGRD